MNFTPSWFTICMGMSIRNACLERESEERRAHLRARYWRRIADARELPLSHHRWPLVDAESRLLLLGRDANATESALEVALTGI